MALCTLSPARDRGGGGGGVRHDFESDCYSPRNRYSLNSSRALQHTHPSSSHSPPLAASRRQGRRRFEAAHPIPAQVMHLPVILPHFEAPLDFCAMAAYESDVPIVGCCTDWTDSDGEAAVATAAPAH